MINQKRVKFFSGKKYALTPDKTVPELPKTGFHFFMSSLITFNGRLFISCLFSSIIKTNQTIDKSVVFLMIRHSVRHDRLTLTMGRMAFTSYGI